MNKRIQRCTKHRKDNGRQAYMVISSDWTPRNDRFTHSCPDKRNKQRLVLNKLCRSDLPEGFRTYKTLKDCAPDINNLKDVIVIEVKAFGETYDYMGGSYVHRVKPIRTISPFIPLNFANDGIGNANRDNKGDYNTGRFNAGSYNSGCSNVGDNNFGTGNHGDYNNGSYNIGDKNNGNSNIGNYNAGRCNEGDYNTGNYNKGHYNVGNNNIGWGNCGHFNMANRSNGAFNTEDPKIYLFNKPSDWTLCDFENSEAYKVLQKLEIHHLTKRSYAGCIDEQDMSDEDKKAYPKYIITKRCTKKKTFSYTTPKKAWNNLTDDERQSVLALPNFDADIFLKITGIDVNTAPPAAKSRRKSKENQK